MNNPDNLISKKRCLSQAPELQKEGLFKNKSKKKFGVQE